jgi:hypothetical protein
MIGHVYDGCPICGGNVHYRGAISVMCNTLGCQNYGVESVGMASKKGGKRVATMRRHDFRVNFGEYKFRVNFGEYEWTSWESTGYEGKGSWDRWLALFLHVGATHVKISGFSSTFLLPFLGKEVPIDDIITAVDKYFTALRGSTWTPVRSVVLH